MLAASRKSSLGAQGEKAQGGVGSHSQHAGIWVARCVRNGGFIEITPSQTSVILNGQNVSNTKPLSVVFLQTPTTADKDVADADSQAIRSLISNVLSGSIPEKEDMAAMQDVLQNKAIALRKRKKTVLRKRKGTVDKIAGPRAHEPATTKQTCWFCNGSGTMDEYAQSLQVPSDDEGDDDDELECVVCWGAAQVGEHSVYTATRRIGLYSPVL